MISTKQKIDQVLGINPNENIDDFLDSLSFDSTLSTNISDIQENVKEKMSEIDNQLNIIEKTGSANILQIQNMNSTMKEVEDLIFTSKKMFKHIYENIITSDLIDAEVVSAVAKLMEGIHINISEFISMYKDRQKYVDKIKLMVFQQEQRKEIEELKHKLALERMKLKVDQNSVDVNSSLKSFNQEMIIKTLAEQERE